VYYCEVSKFKQGLQTQGFSVKTEEHLFTSASVQPLEPLVRTYMPELDAIRGLAILGVLLYHGFYWARELKPYSSWQRLFFTLMAPGQFGVNLFFVLSGFLITGILLDSSKRPDYYRRFYFRRALRILPAYYLTLLLLILFKLTSRGFLLMSLAYSSNLSPIFGIALSYPVLWSLAVEEHFYLLWPAAVRRIATGKLMWIMGGALVLTPLSRLLYHEHAMSTHFAVNGYGYYTWNNLDGLALGAIVAILVRRKCWSRQHMLRLSMLFILSAILMTAAGYRFGILTRTSALGEAFQYVPWNLAFAGMLGMFLLIGSGPRRSLVAPSLIVFFGKISYGLYLYHLMFFIGYDWASREINFNSRFNLNLWEQAWSRMVIAGAAAVGIAYLSRRYFEEPFLRLKDRWPGRLGDCKLEGVGQKSTATDLITQDGNDHP
jgi:peptidoglycan/LPS O-acetylase OafA/YrhL